MKYAALLVTVLGGACTVDYTPLYIRQNQIVGENCVVPTTVGTEFRGSGILDVDPIPPFGAVNPGYVFTPVLINATTAQSMMPTLHLVFLSRSENEIVATGGTRSGEVVAALTAQGLNTRVVPLSGTVSPGGSAGLGWLIVDAEQTAAVRALLTGAELVTVLVRITVVGTMDGGDVTSLPFDYPLTFCSGCLAQDVGPCAGLSDTFMASPGGECNPLQDVTLQCCDGFAVCPAEKPMI